MHKAIMIIAATVFLAACAAPPQPKMSMGGFGGAPRYGVVTKTVDGDKTSVNVKLQ